MSFRITSLGMQAVYVFIPSQNPPCYKPVNSFHILPRHYQTYRILSQIRLNLS